ncbi:amidohydrolase [Thalassorhabdus alkalitolerans]|uniref:Amidohydrolase n=2 Tax=Thalassorhabdus alkalitolerans TaxID=2282697 RepID=A0ABW0YM03_9BACI
MYFLRRTATQYPFELKSLLTFGKMKTRKRRYGVRRAVGTLWYNGKIYTMNDESESVEAVVTHNGRIKAVGTKKEMKNKWNETITTYVDLKGGVVFPGFVDSHLHMIGYGESMLRLDLSQLKSADDMKKALLEKARELKRGQWLLGEGWNENNFPDRKIFHRQELDEIAPDNPVVLTRVCRHAILANSKALELGQVTAETENPSGGVIVRDNDGEATGYLLDAAQELVREAVPEVTDEYLEEALTAALDDMVKKGLVGGHTEDLNYYGGFAQTFDTFTKVIDGKKRKFRAHLLVHHEVVEDMKNKGFTYGEVNEYLSFGGMKIFADGALGGRTALLRQPYNDAPETSGVAMHTRDELKELVKKARSFEMPVAIHTIGDLALEYAIEAVEEYPAPPRTMDRFIHLQIAPSDLRERLKSLPVALDIQPRFVASDFPWVEERLGTWRLPYSFAWKTLLKEGLNCAGGSDAPIEPVDPLLGIHAAVTRKSPGEDHEGYMPEQKLTPFEAVSLFTTGSAKAIGKEETYGKILPGYAADFTVLDKDILTAQPDEILTASVLQTVIDETIVYQKEEEED